jgi:hypothetical protein
MLGELAFQQGFHQFDRPDGLEAGLTPNLKDFFTAKRVLYSILQCRVLGSLESWRGASNAILHRAPTLARSSCKQAFINMLSVSWEDANNRLGASNRCHSESAREASGHGVFFAGTSLFLLFLPLKMC